MQGMSLEEKNRRYKNFMEEEERRLNKDYFIIKSFSVGGLEKDVSTHIERGWIPQGSMVVDDLVFYQPMVKN